MEILKNQIQKAKKIHRCDYCHLQIKEGELYEYSAIKNGSDFYIWKAHIDCTKLAHKLEMFKEAGDDGVDSEFFNETINEYIKYLSFEDKLKIVKERELNEE